MDLARILSPSPPTMGYDNTIGATRFKTVDQPARQDDLLQRAHERLRLLSYGARLLQPLNLFHVQMDGTFITQRHRVFTVCSARIVNLSSDPVMKMDSGQRCVTGISLVGLTALPRRVLLLVSSCSKFSCCRARAGDGLRNVGQD